MAIGSGLDCDDAPYQPYRSIVGWELGVGEIQRTIDVCLRDRAGNTSLMSASIIVDTIAPTGRILIEDGAAVADDTVNVIVRVDRDDPIMVKVVAGLNDCESAEGYGPQADRPFPVADLQEGPNTITVCLRDRAGNTTRYTADVRVDTSAPEILSATLNDGQSFLNSPVNAGLSVQCSDGATAAEDLELVVAAIGVGGPGPVEAYVGPWSPRVRLRLPVVEGPGTLSIVCIDEAGNRSVPSDIEYVLDARRRRWALTAAVWSSTTVIPSRMSGVSAWRLLL